uniref:Uncharacterized protein n=1 Tax=Meloidogyne incognita TaxID=6306 RepID=A0A914MYX5_MELIC
MIQDFDGPNGFSGRKNETVNIEDVLRAVHGIEVEYIPLLIRLKQQKYRQHQKIKEGFLNFQNFVTLKMESLYLFHTVYIVVHQMSNIVPLLVMVKIGKDCEQIGQLY